MHALTQIHKINDQFAQLSDVPEEAPEIDRAPGAFNGCGIQPWSRGPAGSNLPVYERTKR